MTCSCSSLTNTVSLFLNQTTRDGAHLNKLSPDDINGSPVLDLPLTIRLSLDIYDCHFVIFVIFLPHLL